MSNVILKRFAGRLILWSYGLRTMLARYRRALLYASGRLTPDTAQSVLIDCCQLAGWHPLLILNVEETLEQARAEWLDHPELARLISEGCRQVAYKWESYNDDLHEAKRWAIDKAYEYACNEGIVLVPTDLPELAEDQSP